MNTQQKGDIAELAVAKELASYGYTVAFPFGTSQDWDLLAVADTESGLEEIRRFQVKYASLSESGTIKVRAYVTTHVGRTQYKVRSYTQKDLDWVAVYCPETDKVYFIHSDFLTKGGQMILRIEDNLKPGADRSKINWAEDFTWLSEEHSPRPGFFPQGSRADKERMNASVV